MSNADKRTFITYAESEFRPFSELPFNEVDSAVLSWLCYLLIHEEDSVCDSPDGMEITELLRAEYYEDMLKGIYWPEESMRLLFAVVASPRYRGVRIRYYRYESNTDISMQFAAMVFSFSDEMHHVTFRGTDKTVTGWKEDILLLMNDDVPCRIAARDYLNEIGCRLKGTLYVGGHSKGGNMAVYASSHADPDIQERIEAVFSHDGPGFLKSELEYEGYSRMRDRITKLIPSGSMVGLVLENEVEPKYIESTYVGSFSQHYPGSWKVDGSVFSESSRHSLISSEIMENINRWAESVSDDEIRTFSAILFGMVDDSGLGDDLGAILADPVRSIKLLLKAVSGEEHEKKKYIVKTFVSAICGDSGAKDIEDLCNDSLEESDILGKIGMFFRH